MNLKFIKIAKSNHAELVVRGKMQSNDSHRDVEVVVFDSNANASKSLEGYTDLFTLNARQVAFKQRTLAPLGKIPKNGDYEVHDTETQIVFVYSGALQLYVHNVSDGPVRYWDLPANSIAKIPRGNGHLLINGSSNEPAHFISIYVEGR